MNAPTLHVFDCPSCGAPLPPAADGAHVACSYCGEETVVESGGAAMLRERASREEAEALFATLGQPPSWSQRVAAFLVKPKLWLFGFPVLLYGLVLASEGPQHAVESLWESLRHERLRHVASPVVAWILTSGFTATVVVALLVWSLLGERVDARRDLQAALACKPPAIDGGPGSCRHCDAPLELPPGALGVRCRYCGADNLVLVPKPWAARAKKLATSLRLSTKLARERDAVGRRQVRRAALWRVPLVAAMLALVGVPAVLRQTKAGWGDFRFRAANGVAVDQLVVHRDHAEPTHALRGFARCDDPRARAALASEARLSAEASDWCDGRGCTLAAMFALSRGERLRLVWAAPGDAHVRFALAPREYLGGDLVLWDGFGDEVLARDLAPGPAGSTAVEIPIATSGWYKLDLRAAAKTAVEPCVVPAP